VNAAGCRWRLLPGGAALLVLGLSAWIDRPLSALFYRPGAGFFLDASWPAQLVYHGTRWITAALIVAVLATLAWAALTRRRRARNLALYAALAFAIGPGLIVNSVLKEHWGRPRPEQIAEFGGSAGFVPALLPSGSCRHNCSFVSGHAAAGFFLITGAWIWPGRRRTWLAAGLVAGGLIGFTRIVQGGHFFSDVFGALLVVWLTDEVLYALMLRLGWLEAPLRPAQPVA
jgi:lipid A 4'-phosphatase